MNVRWESPLGRRLTELAILTQAREYHQPYEWSLHEMEAVAVGLEPEIVDVVRDQRPVARSVPGLGDREAVIIQMGRELFGESKLSPETYARALQLFGKSNLVDVAGLMAQYAGTATRLTAVNQHMPSGWKNFLHCHSPALRTYTRTRAAAYLWSCARPRRSRPQRRRILDSTAARWPPKVRDRDRLGDTVPAWRLWKPASAGGS